ncbi:glycosyltransferase [Chryseobacterium lacus]|uniref:Glycosyltransferase n=1 Tax=Chryseobacterium lacus TaxID=2058346 RepID=A0A368N0K6_9FLAO|nr:glycosyltransferase [Chryseobacterium lacus]RCU43041.1 glycosyltransferase [Chryseobacterium lacus]RST27891.1 glycosyltransferase [Chryseobacterium lacus]
MTGIDWVDSGIYIFNYVILAFAVSVMLSYIILAVISATALKSYHKKNRFVNYNALLSLKGAPWISIVAPAYNEGVVIIESINSLLSINYNNFEVIVVNDGSSDNTMELLINAYQLEVTDRPLTSAIPSKKIKAVYKSSNPAFSKLLVIDKENGKKADAINAGINVSNMPYVVCIDVDCIMDKDVLLKLAKPFLEQHSKRIIATGGVVRIANSCVIKAGKLIKVNAPDNLVARAQVLEYLRAFLLGRMAWAKLDGLLLISGAFGMFDREIVVKAGGYDTNTVGEDMELVVRMRRYMIDNKLEYDVKYIPDPLCWTEAPESYEVLRKQRSRWTRGTMETLWIHKKILLNPKYKVIGMVSYPYWLLYEYLAPLLEFAGILMSVLFVSLGILEWKFFLLLFAMVYAFSVMFSMMAIYTEEATFRRYTTFRDLNKLVAIAFLEPLFFHPFTVYAALKGNWEKMKGQKGWGEMSRKGFKTSS